MNMFARLDLGLHYSSWDSFSDGVDTVYYKRILASAVEDGRSCLGLASAMPKLGRENRVRSRHSLVPGALKTCVSLIQHPQMFWQME